MGRKKQATTVFDPVLFGHDLREQRRLAGFSNTKLFSEAIEDRTGVFIDFNTLMRFERGEREPDLSKFVAICHTLAVARKERGDSELGASFYREAFIVNAQPVGFFVQSEPGYEEERKFVEEYREQHGEDPTRQQMADALGTFNRMEAYPGGYLLKREPGTCGGDRFIRHDSPEAARYRHLISRSGSEVREYADMASTSQADKLIDFLVTIAEEAPQLLETLRPTPRPGRVLDNGMHSNLQKEVKGNGEG